MNPREPMGLPRGTVRAVLAYTGLVAVIAAAFLKLPTEYFTALLTLTNMMVGFYFGTRPQNNERQ